MVATGVLNGVSPGDVFHALCSVPISYILGVLALYIFVPPVLRKLQGSRYAVINPSPIWDLFEFSSMLDFLKSGGERVVEGSLRYKGKPFVLKTALYPQIVLAPEYIDWVNACPDLEFFTYIRTEFLTHLPNFKFFDPPGHLMDDMCRLKLTTNLAKFTVPLSEECDLAYSEIMGDSPEWQVRTLKSDILLLISRLSAVVFTGGELAHDKEWQKLTIDLTINGFVGTLECRSFPKVLQYLMCRIMPHARRAMKNETDGLKKVNEVIERRRQEAEDASLNGKPLPAYNDALSWCQEMLATGKWGQHDIAMTQLSLALAAIHTSSNFMTEAIFRIIRHPEYVQELREEIIEVIGTQGWSKQALQQLKKLDSFLKETQRLQPGAGLVMHRVALKDVELPGGVHIKKGEQIAISTHLMRSAEFYENPTTFDPWRYAKRREDPALANKSHLVSTSIDHTGFSHGKHSCPGRFFAANEIKIALVHLLMKYDIELFPGDSIKPVCFGTDASMNDTARIKYRRRKEEVQL